MPEIKAARIASVAREHGLSVSVNRERDGWCVRACHPETGVFYALVDLLDVEMMAYELGLGPKETLF